MTVEIKDEEVKRLLSRLSARMKNLKPAMSVIGETVLGSIKENFLSQGRPRRWRRLSPVTIAIRRKLNKWPGRILFRSGRLMRSVNYRPESDKVTIGTKLEYAEMHQTGARRGAFGTVTANVRAHLRRTRSGKKVSVRAHTRQVTVPWGDVPARPFMMVQNEDWEDIGDALSRFIVAGAK
jgi:phage gpG-like protein